MRVYFVCESFVSCVFSLSKCIVIHFHSFLSHSQILSLPLISNILQVSVSTIPCIISSVFFHTHIYTYTYIYSMTLVQTCFKKFKYHFLHSLIPLSFSIPLSLSEKILTLLFLLFFFYSSFSPLQIMQLCKFHLFLIILTH